tara:strand:+ start:53 stop:484 length:432 start_codon:yes stop_codon:yes gene_type:complete
MEDSIWVKSEPRPAAKDVFYMQGGESAIRRQRLGYIKVAHEGYPTSAFVHSWFFYLDGWRVNRAIREAPALVIKRYEYTWGEGSSAAKLVRYEITHFGYKRFHSNKDAAQWVRENCSARLLKDGTMLLRMGQTFDDYPDKFQL